MILLKASQSVVVFTAAAPIAIAMTVLLWASVVSSRSIANTPVEQPQMMAVAATVKRKLHTAAFTG
jgi:hypothetical protein